VNDESLIEVSKLVRSNYLGLKALYENKPASAQVKADASLKCIKMNFEDFNDDIKPMLDELSTKAAIHQTFINSFI
jgi:hypothetical protein